MATIYNNTEFSFSPSAQQAINNACANIGVDEATTSVRDAHVGSMFDLWDNDSNYLFSIDTDGDIIFEA